MIDLNSVRKRLIAQQPLAKIIDKDSRQAAVAVILIEEKTDLELLFIRRAEYQNDPWSGDVAFPGGGLEEQDSGPKQTAERETWEEIGLQLKDTDYLGQLDDLAGAYLPITISCFVYRLTEKPQLKLNGEVVDTFWIPLKVLQDSDRNQEKSFEYRGNTRIHPIINLDGYCEHFLWGISYRILQQFFSIASK